VTRPKQVKLHASGVQFSTPRACCTTLLTSAHPAWKSTAAPPFFCTSGKETVENLKIARGQLAPCQKNRIKRQQTVSSAGCKLLAPNAGFLLASLPSYWCFRPIECSYSQSVSVSVPQDKIRGSAIEWDRLENLLSKGACEAGKHEKKCAKKVNQMRPRASNDALGRIDTKLSRVVRSIKSWLDLRD